MFKNYFKIAWRNIIRHKIYTAINVAGLALGICSCIVIYLVAAYEFSFDAFHPDKDRIYRVMADVTENTGGDKLHFGKLPAGVSQSGGSEITGLDAIAGVIPYNSQISVPDNNNPGKHFESRAAESPFITTAIAQPQYFTIFPYQWLAGNPSTALDAPLKVVLTESKARRYFGNQPLDEIIGKHIIYDDSLDVTVSGIIRDWNKNTDLSFTDFISSATLQTSFLKNTINTDSWAGHLMNTWTFAKLSKGTKASQVNAQMAAMAKKYGDPHEKLSLWLQPLSEVHFDADVIENPIRTADKSTLYSLIAIALFILILAVINFINLSTAQSIQRSKEVGVRKVLGSSRTGLIFQFLAETTLLTVIAVMLAVLLVKPVLGAFHSFIPNGITFNFLEPGTTLFLVSITVVTALLAGLYPAKILSSYAPVLTLKGAGEQRGGEKWLLRKGLIIFQFSVSLIFIIGSIVIANQLNYTRQKNPGFNADAIINIDTPWGDSLSKKTVLAQEINELSGVHKVALQWVPPMASNNKGRGYSIKLHSSDVKPTAVTQIACDEDFIPLYDIKLLAGRNLMHADSIKEIVINENLSGLMGCKRPADAVGKMIYWNDKPYPVVGVVADFHARSFHEKIGPLCIVNRPDREGTIAIKLAAKGKHSNTIKTTISQIEQLWKQVYPASTFKYQFYDETLALLYEKDQQTATLAYTALAITIFISCIGLFGLALFTAEKRSKEISIRKILGASISDITVMLSKDFVKLVIISLVIASPVAWYFMNEWLQTFAYRISVSWWIFVLAGISAVLIALLTVGFQAIKAAVANPVKSLRME
jgi:ABC-type antimicrobial peptide transport system permease subunit